MFDSTRQALADFMEESRKSQRQVSKETGLSTSVISQFLNGTYPGDNQEVAKIIEQYLTVSKERLNSVSETPFYEGLENTTQVLFACTFAHRNNEIALVTGDAGAGKTTALKHYTDTNAAVIFITANACTTTATAVLSLICRKLGKPAPARRAALMELLVDQLSGTNRLIIIDEADQQDLVDLLGMDVFLSVVEQCGGMQLYIPKLETVSRQARNAKIRAEFNGFNYKELSKKYKLSSVMIRNIIKEQQ